MKKLERRIILCRLQVRLPRFIGHPIIFCLMKHSNFAFSLLLVAKCNGAITNLQSTNIVYSCVDEFDLLIAQLVAYRIGTGEVLGSNPGKGENFSMKIISQ